MGLWRIKNTSENRSKVLSVAPWMFDLAVLGAFSQATTHVYLGLGLDKFHLHSYVFWVYNSENTMKVKS